jgi:hypothetical protein
MDGKPVAGFGSHPGAPDLDGRDRIHNILGLLAILEKLAENVARSGKTLVPYLVSQGWSLGEANNFAQELIAYTTYVLPIEAGVRPEVAARLTWLANLLASRR